MKKSATTCENGKFGCVGTEGVGGGWDGAVRSESISSSLMHFAKFWFILKLLDWL